MTFLLAAVNEVPADIELFANKLFSVVAYICLPLLAFCLFLFVLIMTFFIISVTVVLFRQAYNTIFKCRLESEDDKQ